MKFMEQSISSAESIIVLKLFFDIPPKCFKIFLFIPELAIVPRFRCYVRIYDTFETCFRPSWGVEDAYRVKIVHKVYCTV